MRFNDLGSGAIASISRGLGRLSSARTSHARASKSASKSRPPAAHRRADRSSDLIRTAVEALELRLFFSTTVPTQTINTPTTWTLIDAPYNLTGTVIIGPAGSLSIQSGVAVTGSSLLISSGGSITATGAIFSNQLQAQHGATGSISASTFSNAVEFDTTGVTTTTDVFQNALTVVPTFVPGIASGADSFVAGSVINLQGPTVTTPLTLPVIANVSSYALTAQLDIGAGGSLTIASGVTLTGDALVISSGGTLTGTTVTFNNPVQALAGSNGTVSGSIFASTFEWDSASLTIGGDTFRSTVSIIPTLANSLAAGANTFSGGVPIDLEGASLTAPLTLPLITGDAGYDLSGGLIIGSGGSLTITTAMTISGSTLTVAPGGAITTVGTTFDNAVLVQAGATGSMASSTFAGTSEFATAAVSLTNDVFSSTVSVLPTFVPTLVVNGNSFDTIDVDLLGATLSAPLTLPAVTGVSSYFLADNVYVGSGGVLTLAADVVLSGYTLVIGSGGTLIAPTVTFNNPVDVQSGSTGNVSGSTFNSLTEFDATSLIITTDTFTSVVSVIPTFVPSLNANANVFEGGNAVELLGSTVNVTLVLPAITGVTSYDLVGSVFVGSGGVLTVNAGVVLTGTTLTIESGGTLFATTDTFYCPLDVQSGSNGNISGSTLTAATEFDASSIIVSTDTFDATVSVLPSFAPNLGMNSNTFPGSPIINLLGSTITTAVDLPAITGVSDYDLTSNVNVGPAGSLSIDNGVTLEGSTLTVEGSGSILALAVTFDNPLDFTASSSVELEYDVFGAPLLVDGQITSSSIISHDDLSSATASVTSQGTGGPINMTNNWWGTTSVSAISTYKIEDQNDNASLPLVNFVPILTSPVVIPDLLATISAPTVTLGTETEVITVVYSDVTAAISTATIGSSNLTVESPAGHSLTLTETGSTTISNKTTVTYAVTPPNGIRWLPTDDGSGGVTINANSPVEDVDGNAAFALPVPFVIDVPGTAGSTTALTGSATNANVGTSVTFTATVAAAAGATLPTGSVNFVLNGVTLGTATVNSSGIAVFSTTSLPTGTDQVYAEYTGDDFFSSSTSTAFVVNESLLLISSITSLSTSATTLTAGTPITITATVTPGTGGVATPTGSVSFFNSGVLISTVTLQSSGVASLSTTLAAGISGITATYSGDLTYSTSSSSNVTVTATSGSISTLLVSPTTIFFGDDVTLTATVLPSVAGGVTLAGTVEFLENSVTSLGTATIGANGQAVLSTTAIPEGTTNLTAVYAGQGVYSGSTSQVITQFVSAPPNSVITVTVSSAAIVEVGDPVTYNITVASLIGGATPTGRVTFTDNGSSIGSAPLASNGTAVFTTTALQAGTDTVTIGYSGDATYTQSRPVSNSIFIYQVGPVPTATTGTLASSVIAGTVSPGYLEVTVDNPTLATLRGPGTINIYASQSGVIDANSALVQSTYIDWNIKAGTSDTIKVIVKPLPFTMQSGTYKLLASTSTIYGLFNNATSGPDLGVIAQVRTFTGTVTALHLPAAGTAVAGYATSAGVKLDLTNTGNVALKGRTTFLVTASSVSGIAGTQSATYKLSESLKVGAARSILLPLKNFPDVLTGDYYFVVQMVDADSDTYVFSSTTTTHINGRMVSLLATFNPGSFLSSSGIVITLTNTGNIDDDSTFTAVAGYSLNAAGTQLIADVSSSIVTPKILVRHGRSVQIRLKLWSTLPAGLAQGTPYFATLTLTDASGVTTFAVDQEFQIEG